VSFLEVSGETLAPGYETYPRDPTTLGCKSVFVGKLQLFYDNDVANAEVKSYFLCFDILVPKSATKTVTLNINLNRYDVKKAFS